MPHFVVEYSKTLEESVTPQDMVEHVHDAAVKSDLFNIDSVKIRAHDYAASLVGGQRKDFINVTIHLFNGRTQDQKHMLTHLVVEELMKLDKAGISISVQIYDMERETYAKSIS